MRNLFRIGVTLGLIWCFTAGDSAGLASESVRGDAPGTGELSGLLAGEPLNRSSIYRGLALNSLINVMAESRLAPSCVTLEARHLHQIRVRSIEGGPIFRTNGVLLGLQIPSELTTPVYQSCLVEIAAARQQYLALLQSCSGSVAAKKRLAEAVLRLQQEFRTRHGVPVAGEGPSEDWVGVFIDDLLVEVQTLPGSCVEYRRGVTPFRGQTLCEFIRYLHEHRLKIVSSDHAGYQTYVWLYTLLATTVKRSVVTRDEYSVLQHRRVPPETTIIQRVSHEPEVSPAPAAFSGLRIQVHRSPMNAKTIAARNRREKELARRRLLVHHREAAQAQQRKGRVWVKKNAYQIFLRNRALALQAEQWRRSYTIQHTYSVPTYYYEYEWVPVSN